MKKAVLLLLFFFVFVSAACAGDLADVQEAGILKYGTHGDSLPFAFIDQNGELSGIDIALMKEVAERMGVRLDVYEMAPDVLQESLMLGQVDVIGGALAKSSGRNSGMSYSKVYYSADSIFVGPKDMPDAEQMTEELLAGTKIGVQRGSGFETWLRSDLGKAGTVQEMNLYAYSRVSDAMRALARGRIELVLMDANVYKICYQDGDNYNTWAEKRTTDDYVFGMRQGSDLRVEINSHLTDMLNDGTAQEIADSFFSMNYSDIVESMPVTVTDAASDDGWFSGGSTGETQVSENCTYDAVFLGDGSIPDGTLFYAGASFLKTWMFQNTGTCDWTGNFVFEFVDGDRMDGPNLPLGKVVKPGETFNISVNMKAPLSSGVHRGTWQLKTPQGKAVGTEVWVSIIVP